MAEPTAAHLFINAALQGNIPVLEFFLSQKVDPNISNEYGNTALHEVARHGKREIAAFLIEHGADLLRKNRAGMTPMDFADNGNNLNVLYYFRQVRAEQLAKQELLKQSMPAAKPSRGSVAPRTRIA
ncbi:MAG: ankyrin repeat domain-containing protein [Candidatus Micrarchaeia archaeon]